ncbi:SH3 domain-containing protein [Balneolaceae bacterium ANBcel3]|nr:SH3 domain-containing protein [Balneolaceae bacterium ANBcel3]
MKKCVLFILFMSFSLALYAGNPHKTYEFTPGTYRILDSSASIHSEPCLSSTVTEQLEVDSEIIIIESTGTEQAIENKTHYWYNIQYGDASGYVWGGYIAAEAFRFDRNGIDIKAYSRYSHIEGRIESSYNTSFFRYGMILPDDIFIYMDGERVDHGLVDKVYQKTYLILHHGEKYYARYGWNFCDIFEREDHILISLSDRAASFTSFILRDDGKIEFSNFDLDWY